MILCMVSLWIETLMGVHGVWCGGVVCVCVCACVVFVLSL